MTHLHRYGVFLKYQTQIHQDPASRWEQSAFKRFLCKGIDRKILKVRGKTLQLGSYHQCYRLDGKLVAVGVLDLLPHAVSSVYLLYVFPSPLWKILGSYFSYDPEYQHWDFGKLSALREAAMALEMGYDYYYMGTSTNSWLRTLLIILRLLHPLVCQNAIQGDV